MTGVAEHTRTSPTAQQVGQQGASQAGGQAGRQAGAYLNSERERKSKILSTPTLCNRC